MNYSNSIFPLKKGDVIVLFSGEVVTVSTCDFYSMVCVHEDGRYANMPISFFAGLKSPVDEYTLEETQEFPAVPQ